MSETVAKTCELCQGSITAEQIVQRLAGLVKGVLMCPACVEKKRQEAIEAQKAATENLALDDDDAPPPPVNQPSKIRSFATGSTLAGAHHESSLKRPMSPPEMPPTRCRTFNGKLTPAALAHMDDLINEWLDAHPDVYVKHVTCTVGPFEAKHVEQHLILTIFY
jgi:hypothetical protein